jgi:hypothetical protein
VSDDEIERIYALLSQLQHELRGYRADLNGRLRALELADAHRSGADYGRTSVAKMVAAGAGVGSAVAAIVSFILANS